jgi:hypothetical protein
MSKATSKDYSNSSDAIWLSVAVVRVQLSIISCNCITRTYNSKDEFDEINGIEGELNGRRFPLE